MDQAPTSREPPAALRTARLRLRAWRAGDAAALLPILEANQTHLTGWIPAYVSSVVPLPELEQRLAGFGEDFAANRNWRFAIFDQAARIMGEADLFGRSDTARVPIGQATRLEIGYWVRHDETGRGYASEAARALVQLGRQMSGIEAIEIRCDPRNANSYAVAQRLGFRHERTAEDTMVWVLEL